MSYITMKELLEAGVHFGHQTKRWNPKMKPYIFGERNGIYIIDLQKTVRMFKDVYNIIVDMVSNGESILFVGTKKQARKSIYEEANRCEMFYVHNRWLGGMLTNFQTIQQSINRLNYLNNIINYITKISTNSNVYETDLIRLGENIASGKYKMVFIYNFNPASSLPNHNQIRESLMREDLFIIVLENFLNETTKFANIVIPSKFDLETNDLINPYY